MTSKNVLFFPHERATLAAVHDLNVRSKSRRRLQALLTEASTVVQRHTATLDGPERARIGPFEDLVELAERHAAQTKGRIVADLVLLTTVQIGQLLVLAEEQPSLLSTRVYPLAFGAGLLAAGVAVAASTVDDIVTLGLEAVSVSFRLGLALQRRGKDIEDSDEPWARVVSNAVSGSDLEQALERFNASLSPMNRVYIGQLLAESTVIFGPPSTLDAFTKTPEIAPAMALPMKVLDKAPMHGSHLPAINATSIVGAGSVTRKVTELWKRAVDQVAHQRIYMEETVAALVNDLESNTDIILTSIGSSETSGITTLLEKNSILVETSQLSPTPKPYGDDINSIPADAIAVVGMSGRFPDSDTLDEFWKLLETAQTTHQVIPETRFNVDDFYDPTRAKHNALLARYGCFLKNPGDFDHRLFNISPREAMQMDPVQRMLLMTTYEALEMAGYSSSPESEHEQTLPRIATYFGQTVDDWKSINEQQGIDTHFLPGVNRGFAPGRLSHFFQWAGGFYSIDTGCSSSATALCLARDALAAGKYDAAVVGGGTLLTAPEWFAGLSQGGFLSPTGACKTFSDTADGYCRGEGVGVVVLKRLADALRDKDDVVAVIAGASRNCNAGAGSITYPGEKAQGELYRRVMRQAAVRPEQVDVVEMHGTGTQAGDRVEMHAVQGVFAPSNGPQREKPLIVGALKANIGHSEAAAGIISMMKAILVLQHDKIPAQPSQPIKLNPHLAPLIGSQIQLANGQSWTRNGSEPRYIFVNNFDAAGGNVSMLLQDPPAFALLAPPQYDARTHHVIVTSGRTATAHEANRKRLLQYLNEHPDTNLADLAYTTTARRMHNVHRDAYVVSSTSDLLRQLQKPLNDKLDSAPPSAVVFAFTGQGAQSLGMGGALYSTSPAFRSLVDSLQDLCDAQGLLTKFINAIRNPQDEGSVTEVDMQVATVALEIALARYWQSLGIRPTALIGHSLGEYAALCIAGVLSASDTLALAFKRASLIFSRCPPSEAGMLAVNLPMRTVQYRIRDSAATAGCEVCCVNGPSSTVVGGPVAAIDALDEYLQSEDGGKVSTTRLRVQHAFHTRQMDVLLDELEAAAAQVPFRAPTLPVASTVLGRIVKQGEKDVFNAEYLRRHTREPVAFLDAVRACEAGGLISERAFAVEIGPHPICIGLIAACLESARVNAWPSLRRGGEDWQAVSGVMAAAHRAQLPVSWQEFHKDHLGSVRLVSDLPTYAFDLKTFWHSYKSPIPASTVASASSTVGHSRLSSTTLHSVEETKKKDGTLFGKFTVDLSDPKLAKAIGGHVVDESAICPASIFIDMAYTAAAYLEQEQQNTSPSLTTYELTSLEMHSPLVLRDDMEVLPQVWVEAALDTKTNVVSVHFKGLKSPKTTPVEYGSAVMYLAQNDSSARREWSRIQPLVKARVQTLNNAIRPREVHALDTALFYKVFSEIVDYSPPYHAVQEAVIAADFRDAAVTLQLTPTADHGRFISSPFAVDALVHVAGFLLNADVRRAKHEVHIANHIGSLRIVGDISSPGPYHVYATIREQDSKTGTSLCDVYATDSRDNLVAVCTDICFKKLDRDFFALLTGATRGRSPRPVRAPAAPVRAIPTPKRAKQVVPSPSPSPSSSSGSSGTNTPVSRPDTPGSVSDTVDLSDELLEAVAERTGVSVDEMKGAPGTTFTEFGVDSQMAIAILANFQRTTAVELPAAFFTNFPTPADVQQELGSSIADFEEMEMAKPSPKPKVSDSVTVKKSQGPALSGHLLSLVADALGLEDSDLTPSTTFDSVGMDSMLSIKITAAFQSETSVELPAAFFTQNPTVGSAQEALDDEDDTENTPTPAAAAAAAAAAPAKEPTKSDPRQQKLSSAVSRAVLIQGKSQSRSAPLFLTTDGSGTVESYIHLKALPAGRRIYALESPFLEHPETFDLSIEEMASIFLRTIRRIQPTGPYLIGGWSAGSMYAYEVAHRLTREGESIDGLIILDMRAPSLIPTSIVTTEFVNKLGTFEGINRARDLPEDLSVKEREHLMATCRALSAYDAPAFAAGREPKHVAVVWAREGLDNRPDAPVAAMERPGVDIGKTLYEMNLDEFERYFNSWFYGRRETFGMNGWETLVGEGISVHTVNGDHFSMMCPPFAEEVGAVVVETVRRAVE